MIAQGWRLRSSGHIGVQIGNERPEELLSLVELSAGGVRRLVVPQSAVLNSGDRQVVFMDGGDGRFEPREVKIGAQTDGRVEILSGLKAGERIVTSGNFLLDSESRLK